MRQPATAVSHSAAELGPGHSQALSPRPTRPRASARSMFWMHRLLARNFVWSRVGAALEAAPPAYKAFTWVEEKTKRYLFGCRMCAQCALPTTAYACPQTCPKQLRNGPCGGVFPDGRCEVYPEMQCVWVVAYERAAKEGRVQDLRRLVRPVDNRRWGQSSWVNYWRGRDEDLWTADDGLSAAEPPSIKPLGR